MSFFPRKRESTFDWAADVCFISWTERYYDIVSKIFKLQERRARGILDAKPRYSTVDLFIGLSWLTLHGTRGTVQLFERQSVQVFYPISR